MATTVFLHIGIAKTGTTYLQRTLFANRALLERSGTLYPGPGPAAHFFGSLDLRGASFQGHTYAWAAGAWERLVAKADAFDGSTVISHETLAHSTPAEIRRAVASFATDDVRVVVTCRDLARQLPAMWQEKVKNRGTTRYSAFLARTFSDWSRDGGPTGSFWRAQHVPGLVGRWAEAVGLSKVCVVTVPPRGADPMTLWRRFAEATRLPAVDYAFPDDGGNTSLGVAEAEMLRRLNPHLDGLLDWPRYDALVKKGLAAHALARSGSKGRLGVPVTWHPLVAEIAESAVDFLLHSGVHVIGDPLDLRPVFDAEPAGQPSDLKDAELLDVALGVVAELLAKPMDVVPPAEPPVRRTIGRLRQRASELAWSARRRVRRVRVG